MSCKQNGEAAPVIISFEDFIKSKCKDSSPKSQNSNSVQNKSRLKRKKSSCKADEVICVDDVPCNGKLLKHDSKATCLAKKNVSLNGTNSQTKKKSLSLTKQKNHDNDITIVSVTYPLAATGRKSSASTNAAAETQWTEKYYPQSTTDLLPGGQCIAKLISWLESWKEQIKKFFLEEEQEKQLCKSYEDDDDFRLTREDVAEANDGLTNLFLISGRACKTATVHACAKQAGFKVLELNASSDRSSKAMVGKLREATQSHLVAKSESGKLNNCGLKNFFQVNAKNQKAPSPCDSLILIDEVDAELECDKNFWSGINHLATISKRPIVLTSGSASVSQRIEGRYEEASLEPPPMGKVARCIRKIARSEGINISRDQVEHLVDSCRGDVRQAILSLQFWGNKLLAGAPQQMAPSPIHALVWNLPPCDVEHMLQSSTHFHLLQHRLSTTPSTAQAGSSPLRITSHPAAALSGGWADADSEGELLSIAYNRKQIHTHPTAPSKPRNPERSKSEWSSAELKRIVDRFRLTSLCDRLRGEFAAVFTDHSWAGDFLPGDHDGFGEFVEVDYRTEALLMQQLAALDVGAAKMWLMQAGVCDSQNTSPQQLYQQLLTSLRFDVSCARDLHTDVIPSLRAICRAEEQRRATKARRFLHYCDEIGVEMSAAASLMLSQQFIFDS